MMSPEIIGIIGILVFLLLMFLKMPIGFCAALVGFVGFCLIRGFAPGLSILSTVPYSESTKYIMSAVPIFVFMGYIAAHVELTKSAFSVASKWVGHLPGGLAMGTTIGCAAFGAVCGDTIATSATMVPVSLPELRRFKYSDSLSLGCIASAGNLGFLIPPSIGFVIYAILTEESIGSLFMAGIIPGTLCMILFCITIYIMCRKNPALGPAGPKASWRERFKSLKDVWGLLFLFILVMGGLYTGFFTATEGASIGAFGAFVLGLANRKLTWSRLKASLLDTGKLTAMLFILIIGSLIFSRFMTISGIPRELGNFIGDLTLNKYAILAVMLLFYVFVGFFMDVIAVVMITVPIFYPIVIALGFDPVWFGVLILVTMLIGSITPPFGILVFTVHGMVKEVPLYSIFKGTMPFALALVVLLLLLVAIPQIALFLPNWLMPYR